MSRPALLLSSLVMSLVGAAQGARITEQDAKSAVYRIVRYSGLQPNFVVRENPAIPTAVAFIRAKKRWIEYNPKAIAGIVDSARTDWSAVSILAHEIAHHLLGHTLDPTRTNPGDELACDLYSGFILNAMGASMDESLAAMRVAGHSLDTLRHPPRQARLEAIRQGWTDRERITQGEDIACTATPEDLAWAITFEGDPNTYYVNSARDVVWFNEVAEPIVLGHLDPRPRKSYQYTLRWNNEALDVDGAGGIWSTSTLGMMTPIGKLTALAR